MSIPDRKTSVLQRIQKAGHRIINLGEENLFYTNPEDYCVRKLGPDALKFTDLLLVPGERNAYHVREYRPEGECKMAVTGNPRFDVLQPDLRCVHSHRAEEIRRELGRFILVNTNFARVNPFSRGLDLIDGWRLRGLIREGEEVDFLRRHAEFKQRQMDGLHALLKDLASSPAIDKIVVRPHPGENHDIWREWAKPLDKVVIRYEGSANDWIMAAEALLHPGCTTGIEALLLDRPVFSYVPEPDGEFVNEPDMVSEWITTADEFVEGLSRVRGLSDEETRKRFAYQRAKLRSYIVNTEPPYAADLIVDALDRLDVPPVTPGKLGLANGFWQKAIKAIRERKWPESEERSSFTRSGRGMQKLGEISKDEIEVPLTQWANAGVLSRVPQLTRVSSELWALH